jgi:hypothetical protein
MIYIYVYICYSSTVVEWPLIIHETGKHSKQIIIGNNHYYIEGIKTPSCDVVTVIHLLYRLLVNHFL